MVIKREENINKSNKWIEYIKIKSLMKKNIGYESGKILKGKKIINMDDDIDIGDIIDIKKYTGNESIKARALYGQYDYKLIMKNNELPKYEDNVNIWRRMKIIPFEKK